MARRVESLNLDSVANGESLAVAWSLGHFAAVFAADYGEWIGFELVVSVVARHTGGIEVTYNLGVASCMIAVTGMLSEFRSKLQTVQWLTDEC
jgi:hypothetical protein